MNYEQARQIGPDGPAPGKWNWSNSNDSVAPNPYTAWPCAWPDFDWPEPPLDKPLSQWPKVTPTGRERCDHDTQEEAERHFHDARIEAIDWRPIDTETARSLHGCDFPDCASWADGATAWMRGWVRGQFCKAHANADGYRAAHPFTPGIREVHS